MTKQNEVYKCQVCGNIVEVVHAAPGQLVCCGQPMNLMEENTTDAAQEKHVPVVESVAGGTKVTVGSVAHPMEAEHYIEWIELMVGDDVHRAYLQPGQAPEVTFNVDTAGGKATARAYCNLHGLWKS